MTGSAELRIFVRKEFSFPFRQERRDDGIERFVRVVPAARATAHAGFGGVGASGVAVAVPGPQRRDVRVAAVGGGGGDGGAGGDRAAARRGSVFAALRMRRPLRLVSHGRRFRRCCGARHRARPLLALLREDHPRAAVGSSARHVAGAV